MRDLQLLIASGLVGCVVACSGTESPSAPIGSGGSATGGVSGLGGALGSGGTSGGSTGTGGVSTGGLTATGGLAATGGLTATGGTGVSSGGNASGGKTSGGATGGNVATGGSGTGGTSTGGAAAGGSATGGKAGTGGGGAATGGAGGSTSGGSGTGGGSAGGMKSTGCGKAPTLTSGMRSIQSGGANRSFIIRIPQNYDKDKPYRLIFAFHWVGGTANDVASGGTDKEQWSYYGLQELSDNSAILVAPQGISNGWGNSGDLAFVDDMIKQIEGDLCVNTTQLFSVGFSYGGAMTYALACARPMVFRAVAVYSGGTLSGCSGGTQPIAYLGIHGLGDGTLNISGGRTMRDKFVGNNGCTAQNPPEPSPGSLMHTCTSYAGCSSGHPVRWCAFDGGHTPGAVDGGGDSGARTWTKGEVWKFFSQF